MKRQSIFRVPIINTSYTTNDEGRIIVCKLTWLNPISGGNQVSVGVAKCHPDDEFDTTTGMRISESRAKQKLYKTYFDYVNNTLDDIARKHRNLKYREESHEQGIIEQLTD